MESRYCLSKNSRHKTMDTVKGLQCGFSPGQRDGDEIYHVLRAAIFTSVEQAQIAADYCTQWNPVGYVVVRME